MRHVSQPAWHASPIEILNRFQKALKVMRNFCNITKNSTNVMSSKQFWRVQGRLRDRAHSKLKHTPFGQIVLELLAIAKWRCLSWHLHENPFLWDKSERPPCGCNTLLKVCYHLLCVFCLIDFEVFFGSILKITLLSLDVQPRDNYGAIVSLVYDRNCFLLATKFNVLCNVVAVTSSIMLTIRTCKLLTIGTKGRRLPHKLQL